jgi:signal transduction histidine kinase
VARTREPLKNYVVGVIRPEKDDLAWVLVNAYPVFTASRELDHIVVTFIDISERKQAEAEREQLITRLEAQNAELERFAYTVSHDLKSPLITIKGYVGVLREELAKGNTDAVEHPLSRIANATDKMDQLLRELLELSRIGRMMNPPEDVPLGDLARETVALLRRQVDEKGVQVEISPDLPVVFGDRIRLAEVVQNLVDNAVKYMGDQAHPRVEIGSRRDGDETVCYVRDNGIGIAPSVRERVFGLFEQLDPGADGSGIGLSLVKRIVEVHGGRVWVESEGLGHGSTLCFTLARAPEPADAGK